MPIRRLAPHLSVLLLVINVGCAVSQENEIQIGRESHEQFEQEFGGIYPDATVQQYVNGVGMDMARYAGRPELPWQFRVLNSEQINAFAVPGGYIYITQGLLFHLQNEAQLAGILGHEAGHIAHRHSVEQMQRAQGTQGVAVVADIVGGIFGVGGVGDVAGIVGSLSLMSYGRGQEKEADMSGLEYMTRSGYNPRGLVQAMEILQEAGGGGGGPDFLSTHPNPGNRIEYLSEAINDRYQRASDSGDFGRDAFQDRVLDRRRRLSRLELLELPSSWCALCRARSTSPVASGETELLHDVP
ncbi:MAG: M48 family metalloprotease [Tepidisphaeraceae bacterium]